MNEHGFTIGMTETPQCLCHFLNESPQHFLLDRFLFLPKRQTLFTLIEHHVPNFPNCTKKKQMDLIHRGIYSEKPDYTTLNKTLTKAVQNLIRSTKRFSFNETKK